MSEIYTVIVGILGILAVSGLFVGVTNDAVNFLNSAIGSKAASMKIILTVASVGIIIGVVTSSGMMEVARSGVFYPGQFSFQEIMMLFLGMMLGNVLLLDLYNTLGLPTSTTVSMVFGLLGAAVIAVVIKYKALLDGVLAILHDRIYQACQYYIKQGSIDTGGLKNLEYLYKSYHALGGNGTGTELYNRAKALPIKQED